jgi:hypothetical protein
MQPTIYMEKLGDDVEPEGEASRYEGVGANAPLPGSLPDVRLEYSRGAANVYVRGPVTGRPYSFVQGTGGTMVDARDAVALTETGVFRRVGMRTGS